MNVLLLGNGFDLHYCLPTNYHNFLHTIDFLLKNYSSEIKTVGDVFSNLDLQAVDPYIADSYSRYNKFYDDMILDQNKIKDLMDLSNDNIWFRYLLKSFDKDIGWIDFEREIYTVINAFKEFFNDLNIDFGESKFRESNLSGYIIKNFDFFYICTEEQTFKNGIVTHRKYRIKEEFIIEYPRGSRIKKINKNDIIKELYDSLKDFAKMLKSYLTYFIDPLFNSKPQIGWLEKHQALLHNDYVVTLNYTKTFEKLYSSIDVFHLHGDIDDEIVLGINSDSSDSVDTVDTTFISFKKYYQRTMLETDSAYLKWQNKVIAEVGEDIHLLIMGHSLDITDRDIIEDLFNLASRITILYHNEGAKASYITNLIKIFGKSEFDELRQKKQLTFLPTSMDFSKFEEKQTENTYLRSLEVFKKFL